jgi:hypothetical protein
MATVVISTYDVANFPEGGGHFWVYMQYAQGLRRLGCDVYWLENLRRSGDEAQDAARLATFLARMARFGLDGKAILYSERKVYAGRRPKGPTGGPYDYLAMPPAAADAVLRRADLLLNFHYAIDPALLACFRRTALVDIDPGLLQFWISRGQLAVAPHDRYLTTGETVGTPGALIPDCGLPWLRIRPPVCLELWPYAFDPQGEAFTTVSGWQGHDWIREGGSLWENTKRAAFLPFAALPRLTPQPLELALFLTDQDVEERQVMERHGWRIRHSRAVAGTPELYQAYIQRSRGEFSCAKPSCMKFQNAWISDRTLCYLASGKPVVVQHTGPSRVLPNGEGMFRFSTLAEAAEAVATVNADYERHCRAAREIAEAHFDSKQIMERILSVALK